MHCAGVRPEKRCQGQFSFEKIPSHCPVTNKRGCSYAEFCLILLYLIPSSTSPELFSKGVRTTSLCMSGDGKD